MRKNLVPAIYATTALLALAACSNKETEAQQDNVVASEVAEIVEDQVQTPDSVTTETNNTESEVKEESVTQDNQTPVPDWMPKDAKVTPSGLGIVIEKEGDNTRATKSTPMKIHYRGRLTNGTVFDSSYERGEPAVFMPLQVVPGFGEGIMMLGKGGKATLYIPSNLGYGSMGTPGGPIGPNENLIFDIEVVDIM